MTAEAWAPCLLPVGKALSLTGHAFIFVSLLTIPLKGTLSFAERRFLGGHAGAAGVAVMDGPAQPQPERNFSRRATCKQLHSSCWETALWEASLSFTSGETRRLGGVWGCPFGGTRGRAGGRVKLQLMRQGGEAGWA